MRKKTVKVPSPVKSPEAPATAGMLHEVRCELNERISSLDFKMENRFKEASLNTDQRFEEFEHKMNQRFKKAAIDTDKRFEAVDLRFNKIEEKLNQHDLKFKEHDARFDRLESLILDNKAAIHRVLTVVEEQNARNKFVLDGYAHLYHDHKEIWKKIDEMDLSSR